MPSSQEMGRETTDMKAMVRSFPRFPSDATNFTLGGNQGYGTLSSIAESDSTHTDDDSKDDRDAPRQSALSRNRVFGKNTKYFNVTQSKRLFEGNCELVVFELPISNDELESGDNQENGAVLKSVLAKAFQAEVPDDLKGFSACVSKLLLIEQGDGTTRIVVELAISNDRPVSEDYRRIKRMRAAFLQALDDGVMKVAIATSARAETRWPPELRERVAEECLFDDDR